MSDVAPYASKGPSRDKLLEWKQTIPVATGHQLKISDLGLYLERVRSYLAEAVTEPAAVTSPGPYPSDMSCTGPSESAGVTGDVAGTYKDVSGDGS